MLTETLDKLIQEEINKGIEAFKVEHEEIKCELEKYKAAFKEKSNQINELSKIKEQMGEFQTFQSLINENNFESLTDLLDLNYIEINFHGMDSEEIPLWFKLLCTYYKDKKRLFTLMDMFNIEYPVWAKSFKMPFDYGENELDLIFNHMGKMYVCNGQIFSGNMGFYYREQRKYRGDIFELFKRESYVEIPWNLLLQNPLLTSEKYFNKIIQALSKKSSHSDYFFKIQDYQQLNDEQILEMAEYLPTSKFWDEHRSFIESSKKLFKIYPGIAKRFKDKIQDNKYSTFHYLNYPLDMQIEFIIKDTARYGHGFDLVKNMEISKEEKLQLLNAISLKLLDK